MCFIVLVFDIFFDYNPNTFRCFIIFVVVFDISGFQCLALSR